MLTRKRIYKNGIVLTLASYPTPVTAFSLCHERFSAVGSDDDIMKLSDTASDVVDLKRKTVIPGFIETHNHMSAYAMNLLQADCSCSQNTTIDDVKDRIKKMSDAANPGDWILGYGYDDTSIAEKRHLTRGDLDEVSPENPVHIFHISVHFSYVNSVALKIAGITKDTLQPQGGEIHRDEEGVPTGLLMEPGAMNLVRDLIPPYSVLQIKSVLPKAIEHYHSFGITGIHDGGIGYFRHGRQIIEAYQRLEREGLLTMRVNMTIIEEIYRTLFSEGIRSGFGSNRLKLGSVKLWQDGSIQGYTGALKRPYYRRSDYCGVTLIPQDSLNRIVAKYHAANCQVAVHANGDRAIDSVLDAFEAAYEKCPKADRRHMIIHCQMASDKQIERMKQLGIIPNYFVNHVYYWGDRHRKIFLGPERAGRIDPLASSLSRGLTFCLHSDMPVTPVDPIFSIHTAVNRVTKEGYLLGPEEGISVLDALKAYTVNAAYASFDEEQKGTIETGKLADFIVLSENPLNVPSHEIKDIEVMETVVGGETVYRK
ncbi:MAG: amidohydrolase [Deltaproteobacteria bacterium]|nr:amidohydrolase [Deltaproteobacteria bacterium]